MSITKGRLLQMGAFYYEQCLIETYKSGNLKQSGERFTSSIEGALVGNGSLTKRLQGRPLEDEFLKEIGEVSRLATKRMQHWMKTEVIVDSELSDYRYIDEKGRVYKQISLAAESADTGYVYRLQHRPSITRIKVAGDDNYPDYKAVLVPLFGWSLPEEAMYSLQRQDLIAYGDNPWDGIYQKDYLEC